MRWMAILGVVLIVLGVGGLIYKVIPFHHTEQVAKVGSFTANKDDENDVVIPPYAGGAAILAGLVMVVASRRRT